MAEHILFGQIFKNKFKDRKFILFIKIYMLKPLEVENYFSVKSW